MRIRLTPDATLVVHRAIAGQWRGQLVSEAAPSVGSPTRDAPKRNLPIELGTTHPDEIRKALLRLASIRAAPTDQPGPDRQWLLTTRQPLVQVAAVRDGDSWALEICDAEVSGLPLILRLPTEIVQSAGTCRSFVGRL